MKPPFSRTIENWVIQRTLAHHFRSDGWRFSSVRTAMFMNERSGWFKFYLPINVQGLTVLDVGAGEGETAKFFLEHGARKVICIEPHDASFRMLQLNAKVKPIVALNKKFDLADLDRKFDFMKMDIEGYEEALLDVKIKKPAVVEIHGLQLRDKFVRAGWKIKYVTAKPYREFYCACYGYWDGESEAASMLSSPNSACMCQSA